MSYLKNILFIDIRGFTPWFNNEGIDGHHISSLIDIFYTSIMNNFSYVKFLGDGAMILEKASGTEEGSIKDLKEILDKIQKITEIFSNTIKDLSRGYGQDYLSLKLGSGVAKGFVNSIKLEKIILKKEEYIGSRINLAARLCAHAKPSGIIIDRESFPILPKEFSNKFTLSQFDNIAGFREKRVWVSDEVKIDDNLEPFSNTDKTIELHVTGVCIFKGKILLAKRSKNRDIYPGLWAGPGGRVKRGESFEDAVKRKFLEEVNIWVENLELIGTYFIKSHCIPGLIYKCFLDSGDPFRVSDENDDLRFFTKQEVDKINLVPGLKNHIKRIM